MYEQDVRLGARQVLWRIATVVCAQTSHLHRVSIHPSAFRLRGEHAVHRRGLSVKSLQTQVDIPLVK